MKRRRFSWLFRNLNSAEINTEGEVLDTENHPVGNLYAIGNAAGGLFYDNYVGGAQLTAAGVFGMIVAEHVKALKSGKAA